MNGFVTNSLVLFLDLDFQIHTSESTSMSDLCSWLAAAPRPPAPANACCLLLLKQEKHHWKSIQIMEKPMFMNHWKSIEIFGNKRRWLEIKTTTRTLHYESVLCKTIPKNQWTNQWEMSTKINERQKKAREKRMQCQQKSVVYTYIYIEREEACEKAWKQIHCGVLRPFEHPTELQAAATATTDHTTTGGGGGGTAAATAAEQQSSSAAAAVKTKGPPQYHRGWGTFTFPLGGREAGAASPHSYMPRS